MDPDRFFSQQANASSSAQYETRASQQENASSSVQHETRAYEIYSAFKNEIDKKLFNKENPKMSEFESIQTVFYELGGPDRGHLYSIFSRDASGKAIDIDWVEVSKLLIEQYSDADLLWRLMESKSCSVEEMDWLLETMGCFNADQRLKWLKATSRQGENALIYAAQHHPECFARLCEMTQGIASSHMSKILLNRLKTENNVLKQVLDQPDLLALTLDLVSQLDKKDQATVIHGAKAHHYDHGLSYEGYNTSMLMASDYCEDMEQAVKNYLAREDWLTLVTQTDPLFNMDALKLAALRNHPEVGKLILDKIQQYLAQLDFDAVDTEILVKLFLETTSINARRHGGLGDFPEPFDGEGYIALMFAITSCHELVEPMLACMKKAQRYMFSNSALEHKTLTGHKTSTGDTIMTLAVRHAPQLIGLLLSHLDDEANAFWRIRRRKLEPLSAFYSQQYKKSVFFEINLNNIELLQQLIDIVSSSRSIRARISLLLVCDNSGENVLMKAARIGPEPVRLFLSEVRHWRGDFRKEFLMHQNHKGEDVLSIARDWNKPGVTELIEREINRLPQEKESSCENTSCVLM